MSEPIDFYFDFSSPYGYFAAEQVDALGARHGRTVEWHPILLGAVFKVTGQQPLPTIPIKGDYARHDLVRSARYFGVPFRFPSRFPIATTAACRAYYGIAADDRAAAKTLALALYRAYFASDRDISAAEAVIDVGADAGLARDALARAIDDPAQKQTLRSAVDAAIARGVFGSPYIVVDGEPFWGADRLDQVERWLDRGGW